MMGPPVKPSAGPGMALRQVPAPHPSPVEGLIRVHKTAIRSTDAIYKELKGTLSKSLGTEAAILYSYFAAKRQKAKSRGTNPRGFAFVKSVTF